ncbi:putative ribonuclease H-like domain-containing protein [Tanacetum coccineum]|uniref:Ribonuclease H-like domain-containing protein n=1 Tax=Tanacetum coccineum TaxID=301880 RepID=A0ABQ5DLL2_9ASTR
MLLRPQHAGFGEPKTVGNPQQMEYKVKGINDSDYSRHMTGNKCYLTEYEDYEGGFVSFGDGKGRITRKGKIKTGTLDFDDVYFCKELKYNLFSVSQMCDKRNNVLFIDTKCIILSSNFKLLDESQVLLKVPRKDNIYSVDLKSIIPIGGLTCLLAKATIDESNLWHRRLGHINFKNINKLVKGNLVRGLPSKIFENNHTCVACQKGKQHKPSCKANLDSISKPLHMLHMDLFGPTNVKSLLKKSYCLVITDDYSRFSWIFFLATKDETSGILKTFITGIENQLDHKVKIIRYDNGTKFKNSVMNQFCESKGIKKEFSVARTPQQNGVAEKKNRTLIEAARTMVLITKPHNKTPYELIHERTPLIDFRKPFGCPVTILNTRDYLGKFKGKANEGFFVGYSVVSKAMRVFNKRTRIIEETLNISFLENTPNVKGNGPDWIFDVDSLTISMNYVPVMAKNQINAIAGIKDNIIAGRVERKKELEQVYILIPFYTTDPFISKGPKASEVDAGEEHSKEGTSGVSNNRGQDNQVTGNDFESEFERLLQQEKQDGSTVNTASSPINTVDQENTVVNENVVIRCSHDPNMPELEDTGIFDSAYDDEDFAAEGDMNNLEDSMPESPNATTKVHKDHPIEQIIGDLHSAPQTRRMTRINEEHGLISLFHKLRRTNHKDFSNCLFACFLSQMEPKKPIQALKDPSWVEAMQDELIQFKLLNVWTLVDLPRGKIDAIRLFLAYASYKDFVVNQMDVKSVFLYGKIEERVYVCQPLGFEDLDFPDKVYKVEKALYGLHQAPRAWYETLSTYLLDNGFHKGQIDKILFIQRHKDDILLVQVYVDDIIFGSTKKKLSIQFEKLMHDKFQISSMGELSFFLGLQVQQKSNGIFISQHKYVAEILKKFDFAIVKTASTPMDPNKALIKDE